jgi:hypothetical protein
MPDGGPAQQRLLTRPSTLTVAEVAWVALVPCAALAVLAIVVLGPPLGHLLFTHTSDSLWPPTWWETTGRQEPAKQGRFLLAALAPLLLVGAILAGARRRPALPVPATRALVFASYGLVLGLVAIALLEQRPAFTSPEEPIQTPVPAIFDLGRVVFAAACVALAVAALQHRALATRIARIARETPRRRLAALAFATAFAATWVLKAVTTDRLGLGVISLNLPWTLNDSIAVLDGRTPLVDFHPIYAKLLPYVTAPVLAVFGTSAFVYTTFMALLSGLALIAVYATFRRVTRSSLLACALFVPFVATSDVRVPIELGVDAGRDASPMLLACLWPMRYGSAYLLVWLTARHLDGSRPHRPWLLFLVGGLLAIDNMEFGIAAVVATTAALLCAQPPSSLRSLRPLLLNAVAGVLAAVGLVVVITFAWSGQLPDFGLLLEWPRIFTTLGWFSMPLRTWDLHLAVYATFVAAIAVAAVRLVRRADDALLTSMLAWSGVFGLLTGGYFVGRPDAIKLTTILSGWSFALSMLTVASVRAMAARGFRPTAPQLLVLFGFALSVSSLALLSPPQRELDRLREPAPESAYMASAKQFIGERTRPGEKVAVLVPMSFAITHELRLHNVAPYGFMNAIVTESQMTRLLRTLHRERVSKVFVPAPRSSLLNEGDSAPEQLQLLETIGFQREQPVNGVIELRSS